MSQFLVNPKAPVAKDFSKSDPFLPPSMDVFSWALTPGSVLMAREIVKIRLISLFLFFFISFYSIVCLVVVLFVICCLFFLFLTPL